MKSSGGIENRNQISTSKKTPLFIKPVFLEKDDDFSNDVALVPTRINDQKLSKKRSFVADEELQLALAMSASLQAPFGNQPKNRRKMEKIKKKERLEESCIFPVMEAHDRAKVRFETLLKGLRKDHISRLPPPFQNDNPTYSRGLWGLSQMTFDFLQDDFLIDALKLKKQPPVNEASKSILISRLQALFKSFQSYLEEQTLPESVKDAIRSKESKFEKCIGEQCQNLENWFKELFTVKIPSSTDTKDSVLRTPQKLDSNDGCILLDTPPAMVTPKCSSFFLEKEMDSLSSPQLPSPLQLSVNITHNNEKLLDPILQNSPSRSQMEIKIKQLPTIPLAFSQVSLSDEDEEIITILEDFPDPLYSPSSTEQIKDPHSNEETLCINKEIPSFVSHSVSNHQDSLSCITPPIYNNTNGIPNYNLMTLEQLQKQVKDYGLKPSSKMGMIHQLQEIWHYSISKNENHKNLDSKASNSDFSNKNSTKDWDTLLKENTQLYKKILLLEPVPLEEFYTVIKKKDVKCTKKELVSWLDSQVQLNPNN